MSRSVPRFSIRLATRAGTGFLAVWLLGGIAPLSAATYHVSPTGDDAKNGLSPATAWKTVGKVNAAKFSAGDRILFARGGEWRESLVASSSGTAGSPITYDAYGKGAKPKFYGSDLLANAKFTPAGGNNYNYPMPTRADSALENQVFIASTWNNGSLTITTSGADPRTNGKTYTACTRGNVIFSARQNHLVFRNLVADETAGQIGEGAVQGYGVRIEGSTDVLVENCEANRCGRHHFGIINTTGFVGRHLHAEYVQPKTPGGNSIYVSYADGGAPVASCTSEWDDITAAHLEDGNGGQCLFFVSHGERQGLITMKNAVATTKISFMSKPVIFKGGTLRENASIENWGTGVLIDGVTLVDSAAIDQWASDGVIQNCVAHLTPSRGGPTGFSTAVLCRDKAKRNVVRFNTLVTKNFSCLAMGGADSATKWYGNIMLADGVTVSKASALGAADVAYADYNFYAPTATFAGATLAAWKGQGFDAHSKTVDPKFVDPAGGKYGLQATSPCIAAAGVNAADVPPTDAAGTARRPAAGKGYDMGAFASGAAPASSPPKAPPPRPPPPRLNPPRLRRRRPASGGADRACGWADRASGGSAQGRDRGALFAPAATRRQDRARRMGRRRRRQRLPGSRLTSPGGASGRRLLRFHGNGPLRGRGQRPSARRPDRRADAPGFGRHLRRKPGTVARPRPGESRGRQEHRAVFPIHRQPAGRHLRRPSQGRRGSGGRRLGPALAVRQQR